MTERDTWKNKTLPHLIGKPCVKIRHVHMWTSHAKNTCEHHMWTSHADFLTQTTCEHHMWNSEITCEKVKSHVCITCQSLKCSHVNITCGKLIHVSPLWNHHVHMWTSHAIFTCEAHMFSSHAVFLSKITDHIPKITCEHHMWNKWITCEHHLWTNCLSHAQNHMWTSHVKW